LLEDETLDAWIKFMKQYDQHSTRPYLQFAYVPSQEFGVPLTGLPCSVVDWMETFEGSTGGYDRALTEMVLDAISFGVVGPKSEWWCIRYAEILPYHLLD
jgi:hypothetical protein